MPTVPIDGHEFDPKNIPQDISSRAIDLGRLIDRLPPGRTVIVIDKGDVRAMDWLVEVLSVHHNRTITLSKRKNGAANTVDLQGKPAPNSA